MAGGGEVPAKGNIIREFFIWHYFKTLYSDDLEKSFATCASKFSILTKF